MPTTQQHTTTVLLVDDHPLMRKGLRTLLESETDIAVIGDASDGQEAINQVKTLAPDVTIMDISMPNLNGIEATRRILAEAPETRIIALSIHAEKRFVDEMLGAGARAYILKDSAPEELVHAIHLVMQGESFLSAPVLGTVVSGHPKPTLEAPEESTSTQPILQTKLHRPPTPPDLVPRTRLLERIEAGRVRPLILVSAPAGYGKSISISSWLETLDDWPCAWLSLDENDSDLRQFLGYFLAAVKSAFPQACEQTQILVSAPQLPSLATLLAALSNELNAIDRPFTLVLDDYHHINAESPVNDLIQQLLAHPPIPLHLIIISRRDPPLQLLTLRAQGQLTEVRMQDLLFDPEESRALFENTLGFTIGDDALIKLQQEMEGWVAGLRLVSLALHGRKNRDVFLKKLDGGIQQTQEYLIHEVITRQSPLMQDWLMRSSILNRFCEPLVLAVCANETRAGAVATDRGKFIEAVVAGNLFVVSLDRRDEWFRYHHQFRQLLQNELNRRMAPDEIAGLHLRASEWFESHSLIEEAIQHAMKAGDGVGAAKIVERHQLGELHQNHWYIVERWLAMLPLEIIQQRPKLLLTQLWGLYFTFQLAEIPPLLELLEPLLADTTDETVLGEANFYRGLMLVLLQNDAESALIRFRAARKRFSRSQTDVVIGELEIEVWDAVSHQMVGETALAIHSINQRIHAMSSGNDLMLNRLALGLTLTNLLTGNLAETVRAAQILTSTCKKVGLVNTEGTSRFLQANADLQSYRLDEALQGFGHTAQIRDIVHRKVAIETQVGLVLTYQALQRSEEAANAMKQLMQFALDTKEPQHIYAAQSCQARLSLFQDDLKSAIDWADSYDDKAHVPGLFLWLEVPLINKARILIASDSPERLQYASELLAMLRQSATARHNTYQLIGILVLQCIALEKLGRADEALEVLRQAIMLAKPGGWIRPFVELGQPMAKLLERLADQQGFTGYLHLVLDKFPTGEPQQPDTTDGEYRAVAGSEVRLAEPLTLRELDVLELLAQRLQTKEIAASLFVSPETVKSHLKHLYQKLDVYNRRDAAIKAAEILSRRCDAS